MFRVRVMELRGPIGDLYGGASDYDRPYHTRAIFVGVRLETAWRWLKKCGWGMFLAWMPAQQYEWPPDSGKFRTLAAHLVNDCAPMRLRLKGRCWIEDPDRPATMVRGEYDPVDLPARVRAAAEAALDAARARLQPRRRRKAR